MVPERITQLLTAYVDGELSSRQRKEVSRLLRKSSEARKLYHQIKGDSLVLRRLPRKKPKIDLTDTVLGNIAAANLKIPIRPEAIPLPPGPPPLPSKTIPAWVVFAVAAGVLLIVGIGSYFYFAAGGAEINRDLIADPRVPAKSGDACPGFQEMPQPEDGKNVFAYPNLKVPSFQTAQVRVPLVLSMREADQASFTDEVQQELQKDGIAFRCDLFSENAGQAFDRFKAQLAGQGTELKIDPSLEARVNQGEKVNVAFYAEGLTAADLTELLQQLGKADRQGLQPFTRVAITQLPPWRGSMAGIDLRQPLEDMTLDQVLQGGPPRPGQPAPAVKRTAAAIAYNPAQVAPSAEVKSLLNSQAAPQSGTLQVLFVLWGS